MRFKLVTPRIYSNYSWHAIETRRVCRLITGYTDLQIGHRGLYNSVSNYGSDSL